MDDENESDIKYNNKINQIEEEEEIVKRKSLNNNKKEMLMIFKHQDEKKDLNIVYNEVGNNKKIKYISLDLLLKKIVIDDFIEKNILLIYYFCQQCFCFIETKILFNKIYECFEFYLSQGVPIKYLSNIITFFNILIIEMYDYYQEIKQDDPAIPLINQFYERVIKEFSIDSSNFNNNNQNSNNQQFNLQNNNKEKFLEMDKNNKIHMTKNIKKINSISNKNEDRTEKYSNNYYSINDDNNIDNLFNDNYKTELNNKNISENKDFDDNNKRCCVIKSNIEEFNKIENLQIDCVDDEKKINYQNVEDNNVIIDKLNIKSGIRRTVFENINNKANKLDYIDIEKDLVWSNTQGKKINIENKYEIKNRKIKEKDKKHFHIFNILSPNEKKKKLNKSVDIVRKNSSNNDIKNIRKYKTQDEQVLNNIKDIKNLLLLQNPKKKYLDIIKNSIIFYKLIKNKLFPNRTNIENKKLRKSRTQDNIFKKKKKIEEKDYFNILDWDEKDIGNKLMSLSESLIKKVQRKELYKAVYLKKNKYIISPNVMENIDKFNRLSFFIMLDILSYDYPKDRAKMIEKWVKIAEYCKKINNFNDLFAINSALNNYIITGLQLTFKEVHKKIISSLKEINKFCDCLGNYKTVRDYIKNLKPDVYYLPYLGILLRDLAFYEENSKYIINEMLINFEKIEKIQLIMENFFKFRFLPKKEISEIPAQLNFFDNLENIQEEKLERIANNIEPNFNFAQKKLKRLTYIDKKFFLKKGKSNK